MIAAKELCVRCLCHSNLDAAKESACTRRDTPPHLVGNKVRDPDAQLCTERELLLVHGGEGGRDSVCLPH